jgi:hypothetical protein
MANRFIDSGYKKRKVLHPALLFYAGTDEEDADMKKRKVYILINLMYNIIEKYKEV